MTATYQTRGDVAVITLDNPPVNGLGYETRLAIVTGLERALGDAAVKAIVINGAGKAFSGGADIREFGSPKALAEPNLLSLIRHFEACAKPLVAAVHSVVHGRWARTRARLPLPRRRAGNAGRASRGQDRPDTGRGRNTAAAARARAGECAEAAAVCGNAWSAAACSGLRTTFRRWRRERTRTTPAASSRPSRRGTGRETATTRRCAARCHRRHGRRARPADRRSDRGAGPDTTPSYPCTRRVPADRRDRTGRRRRSAAPVRQPEGLQRYSRSKARAPGTSFASVEPRYARGNRSSIATACKSGGAMVAKIETSHAHSGARRSRLITLLRNGASICVLPSCVSFEALWRPNAAKRHWVVC